MLIEGCGSPEHFMVDDCKAEHNAIRKVFGNDVNVLLCTFHVVKSFTAWVKAHLKDSEREACTNSLIGLVYCTSERQFNLL